MHVSHFPVRIEWYSSLIEALMYKLQIRGPCVHICGILVNITLLDVSAVGVGL